MEKKVSKIDALISEIEGVNSKAAKIIKKRKNLLAYNTTVDTIDSLIQAVFRTYHESYSKGESTHLDVPFNARSVEYFIEQLVYFGKDYNKVGRFIPKYKKTAFEFLKLDTKLRNTNTPTKRKLKEFVRYDTVYNNFLNAHSKVYEILGETSNGKHPYQTGIQ
jgi:hypothetical protein